MLESGSSLRTFSDQLRRRSRASRPGGRLELDSLLATGHLPSSVSAVSVGEENLQLSNASRDARLHGAEWNLQDFGDLRITVVL